jgi:hypothetical protein
MNPRQMALLVWVGIALIWCLLVPKVRSGLLDVARTALDPKLLIPAILSLAWIGAAVYGLFRVGAWTPSIWWDTAAFVLVGSTGLVWRMMKSKDYSAAFYRALLLQTFAISAIIGVVTDTYTFNLPVELLLVPWLFLLGGVQALAGVKNEYESIRKPVAFVIGLTGLAMISRAVGGAIADYTGFFSLNTVRSLLLVSELTIAYIPFLFLLRVSSQYELAFIPLKLGVSKPFLVRSYARARILARHGFRLDRLSRFRAGVGNDLRMAGTRAEVDEVFARDATQR